MRILVLADNYFPSRAACAVRMKVFAEMLIERGHDVHVLASNTSLDASFAGYEQPEYVHFFPVEPMGEKTALNRFKNNFSISNSSVSGAKPLGQFDVVIATSPPLFISLGAIKVAKNANAKLVFDVRDIWPDVAYEMDSFAPGSLYGRIFTWMANKAYKKATLVTTVSPGKVEKLKGRIKGDKSKVVLVPNGLDVSFVEQATDQEVVRQFRLDEGPICSYVGNIGLAQGLGTIFELAKHRPDVRFLVFGKGAEKNQLEARAKEENLSNLEFCGTLDAQGAFTVLSYSSVSFAPLVSSNLKDSIPTKIFEAIGCGCPVLLAAAGDSVDLLNEMGLGASAAPEDIEGLKRALDSLIDRPYSEEQRKAAAGLAKEKYSRQFAATCFEEMLSKAVTK
ncbi:MAG: glycosyltransferase family 4 protein [Coriobacteriia bacterium]|nr:glycosyltransferase family 4 protein [Coriobacteriia bacterium]